MCIYPPASTSRALLVLLLPTNLVSYLLAIHIRTVAGAAASAAGLYGRRRVWEGKEKYSSFFVYLYCYDVRTTCTL
ncbi:hypothetical protein R3P38DRAFT_2956817, partial [Favolaschia claudopus]